MGSQNKVIQTQTRWIRCLIVVALMVVAMGFFMGSNAQIYANPATKYISSQWLRGTTLENYDVIATTDGGFVRVGDEFSIAKFDIFGKCIWQSKYSHLASGEFKSVVQNPDGGFYVVGQTSYIQFVAASFDANGNNKWFKIYPGNNAAWFNGVTNSNDGGFVAVGGSRAGKGLVSGNNGYDDCAIAKFDGNGNPQWAKNVGGTGDDEFNAVVLSDDGGYLAVGKCESGDGDFLTSEDQAGGIAVKFDALGNKLWTDVFGFHASGAFNSVANGIDGGYVAAGRTGKLCADLEHECYDDSDWLDSESVIVKYDGLGNTEWVEIGDNSDDDINCIRQTSDGGYIAAGSQDTEYRSDFIAKFDKNGGLLWRKNYGVYGNGFCAVAPCLNDGYVVAGRFRGGMSTEDTLYPYIKGSKKINSYVAKISENNITFKLIPNKIYTGKAIRHDIKIKMGNTQLFEGKDYTLQFKNNKAVGVATVTIKGEGIYYGSQQTSFEIMPKKVKLKKLKVGKKKLAIAWKRASAGQKVSGYQIRYKIAGSGKWSNKYISIKKASSTIKSLSKGRKYRVQIRSYKTTWNKEEEYEARQNGEWSGVKTSSKIK